MGMDETITSPNYPSNYDNDKITIWHFSTDINHSLEVEVVSFEVQYLQHDFTYEYTNEVKQQCARDTI